MYNQLIFRPLYNGLVWIMDVIPGIDVGIAVIIFTCIVKLILFPLSKSALLTQVKMKEVEPEVNKIKSQYANDRQLQASKTMELYKERNVRPFLNILLIFIQLPIIFALISVFYKIIPTVNPELLYSFVHVPVISPTLFGLDLTQKSLILALATGVIQYLQLHFSVTMNLQKTTKDKANMDKAAEFANSMNAQMKFLLPIVAFASVYWIIPASFPQAASMIAIYWSVSSLFTLGQELYISKMYIKKN